MTGEDITLAAQLACLLEVSAPKPGNISPGRHFHDTSYEDFLASAVAIGPALAASADRALGSTIRAAIEATVRWAGTNTNLGMVLLLAPLAYAARLTGGSLRERVQRILAATTVADAVEVYAAIRLAHPGGLGSTAAEDVAGEPTVTLTQAMALATDRDSVAREYATGFSATFEIGAPALRDARRRGIGWSDATVYAYLALLAALPDTLIARKLGRAEAERISRRAAEVRRGGPRELTAFDAELRDGRNARNPGTTADLTCASIFAVILEDGWNR